MALIITPEDRNLEPYPGAKDGLKLSRLHPDDPYVHITEVPPGYRIDLHSHSETEVTVILAGAAIVGDRYCGTGSVLVIVAQRVAYRWVTGQTRVYRSRYKSTLGDAL